MNRSHNTDHHFDPFRGLVAAIIYFIKFGFKPEKNENV